MAGPALRIAASHALATSYVPGWLDAFQSQGHAFRTRAIPAAINDGAMLMSDGNCDLMLVHERTDEPSRIDPARYPSICIDSDELIPVSRPNEQGEPIHALSNIDAEVISLAAYSSTTLFGRSIAELLSRSRQSSRFRAIYESEWDGVIKRVALNGRAMAWLSRKSVEDELASGTLVHAGGASWVVPFAVKLYRDVLAKNEFVDRIWLSALPQS